MARRKKAEGEVAEVAGEGVVVESAAPDEDADEPGPEPEPEVAPAEAAEVDLSAFVGGRVRFARVVDGRHDDTYCRVLADLGGMKLRLMRLDTREEFDASPWTSATRAGWWSVDR